MTSCVLDSTFDLDFFCEDQPQVQTRFQNYPCEYLYLWDQLGVCRLSALRYQTSANDWKTWTSCRMLLEYAFDNQGYTTVISNPRWLGPWTDFVKLLGLALDQEWSTISEKTTLGFFENSCEKQLHEYIFYREFCTQEKITTCAIKCNCVNGNVDVLENVASNPFAPGVLVGQFIPEYTMEEVKDKTCDEANVQRFFSYFYPLILNYFENKVSMFGDLSEN